jgi:hypothetical protein
LVGSPAPRIVRCDMMEPVSLGRSVIKRVAIVPASRYVVGSAGSAANNEVSRSFAFTLGNRARLAASCQGSTSNRAKAERTLSFIPFRSSSTGAKRKASNSDPRRGVEAECIILRTASAFASEEVLPARHDHCPVRSGQSIWGTAHGGRVGIYLSDDTDEVRRNQRVRRPQKAPAQLQTVLFYRTD